VDIYFPKREGKRLARKPPGPLEREDVSIRRAASTEPLLWFKERPVTIVEGLQSASLNARRGNLWCICRRSFIGVAIKIVGSCWKVSFYVGLMLARTIGLTRPSIVEPAEY
jgi:hypothetical protein